MRPYGWEEREHTSNENRELTTVERTSSTKPEQERLEEEAEELECIREYEAAKAAGEEAIPLDQAVAEIESPGR